MFHLQTLCLQLFHLTPKLHGFARLPTPPLLEIEALLQFLDAILTIVEVTGLEGIIRFQASLVQVGDSGNDWMIWWSGISSGEAIVCERSGVSDRPAKPS